MKKLSRILRSERGDLLVGSLVSVIIVGIVMAASASFLMVAGKASLANSHATSKTILLNSTLADELPRAGSYTTAPKQIQSGDTTVSIRREDTSGGSILHAATNRHDRPGSSCTGTAPDSLDCILASTPIPAPAASKAPAPAKLELKPGTDGIKYRISVPKDASRLQYVFKAKAGDKESTLTFSGKDSDAKSVVKIPADGSGYYYGSLRVEPGTTVTVKTTGPATYAADTFTVYEAPDEH